MEGAKQSVDGVTGVDVLAVTAKNINDYACGSWALVVRDVEQLLAAHCTEVLAVLEAAQVPQACRRRHGCRRHSSSARSERGVRV